jgi:hypothetical protein
LGEKREEKIYVVCLQSKNGTRYNLNMKPNGTQHKFTIKLVVIFTGMIMSDGSGGTGQKSVV